MISLRRLGISVAIPKISHFKKTSFVIFVVRMQIAQKDTKIAKENDFERAKLLRANYYHS
jgi:hypothetical protein